MARKLTGEPVGRPTDYKPEYCEQVIEHMKQGASLTSFAAQVGVARSTINVWMEQNPEFKIACHTGKAWCAAWWEEKGRKIAESGGGNGSATMVTFGLKNMASDEWVDRQQREVSGPDGGPIETKSTIDLEKLTLEQLQALREIVSAQE